MNASVRAVVARSRARPQRWRPPASWSAWLPAWSRPAAYRAVRATLVVPGLFAFTDQVIGNLQMAIFAAFGGFATLVLAAFGGSRRDKLVAHFGLAVVGSVLLMIGIAVNSSTAVAAIVSLPVAFVVLFAGVAGPTFASGVTGALLLYVLPAASRHVVTSIPSALAGWWMVSVLGTLALLVLSPSAGGDPLRGAAARTARALAAELKGALAAESTAALLAASMQAEQELQAELSSTPYRPTGLATSEQALANAALILEWCAIVVRDCLSEGEDLSGSPSPDRELLDCAADLLDDVAALFSGQEAYPDLEAPGRLQAASGARVAALCAQDRCYDTAVKLAFHAETISLAARALAADAVIAAGVADPRTIAAERRRWYAAQAEPDATEGRLAAVASAAGVARRHASIRSVWLLNSLRSSVALAAAVMVADLTDVQHGFWVVLGTLSVLRGNAASTGSTAARALLGTVAGFVVGGALILAIGTTTAALWAALPVAVLVAAYAPGTAPFAVGQAAFTVMISVLFNLLVPVGWKLGVVRVQDVALGCGVSLIVGVLLWPRGASSVVADDLADGFRSGAAFLTQAVDWALGRRPTPPDAGLAAVAAGSRLEDALRGFLTEQGAKHLTRQELWRLVGATHQLRVTAYSLATLHTLDTAPAPSAGGLSDRARHLTDWFERLAEHMDRPHRGAGLPPSLAAPLADGDFDEEIDVAPPHQRVRAIWIHEHLRHLAERLDELIEPATHVAAQRRRPWWR